MFIYYLEVSDLKRGIKTYSPEKSTLHLLSARSTFLLESINKQSVSERELTLNAADTKV